MNINGQTFKKTSVADAVFANKIMHKIRFHWILPIRTSPSTHIESVHNVETLLELFWEGPFGGISYEDFWNLAQNIWDINGLVILNNEYIFRIANPLAILRLAIYVILMCAIKKFQIENTKKCLAGKLTQQEVEVASWAVRLLQVIFTIISNVKSSSRFSWRDNHFRNKRWAVPIQEFHIKTLRIVYHQVELYNMQGVTGGTELDKWVRNEE